MVDLVFSGNGIARRRADPSRIGDSIVRIREELRSLMGVVMKLQGGGRRTELGDGK